MRSRRKRPGELQPHQAEPYDAVILDLNLPRMSGLQVCEQLRAQGY